MFLKLCVNFFESRHHKLFTVGTVRPRFSVKNVLAQAWEYNILNKSRTVLSHGQMLGRDLINSLGMVGPTLNNLTLKICIEIVYYFKCINQVICSLFLLRVGKLILHSLNKSVKLLNQKDEARHDFEPILR